MTESSSIPPKPGKLSNDTSAGKQPSSVHISSNLNIGHQKGGQASGVRIEHVEGAVVIGLSPEEVAAEFEKLHASIESRQFSGECPYIGLNTFQEDDAGRFFGRESLVAELFKRVQKNRFLVVAGP